MARSRNIKPGFYKNEDLAECSVWARYIFPGLWMLADREGRLEDRPKRIKGELLPFDSQDVEPLLKELSDHGFIIRYQNDDGRFIQISKFSTHQTPHYSEKKSEIKAPELQEKESIIKTNSENHGSMMDHKFQENSGELQEHSKNHPIIKEGSQPPDSLIPDSLIPDSLIPDSLIPDSLIPDCPKPESSASGLGTTTADETKIAAPLPEKKQEKPKPTRAGSIAVMLRTLGIDTASIRDEVIEWAEKKVPDTILAEAVAIAKNRKPNERIASAYLAPIVADLLNPKPSKSREQPWWATEKTIEAKAREVGCWPARGGETWIALKARISEKLAAQQGADAA